MTSHCDNCLILQRQVVELKRQLAPARDIPDAWRLTPSERVIYDALSKSELVSKERIAMLLWRDTSKLHQHPDKTIQTIVCNLRRKLAAHTGQRIVARAGIGYVLEGRPS